MVVVPNLQHNEDDLDREILILGKELWRKAQGAVPSVFDRSHWQGRALEWAMQDPGFKVDLFRLVDVLPSLQGEGQIAQHVREYLSKEDRRLPHSLSLAVKAASSGVMAALAAVAIRHNCAALAHQFISGRTPEEAMAPLRRLHDEGIAFTVALLGEETLSDAEADVYQQRYIDLINQLAASVDTWPDIDVIDYDDTGRIPRAAISVKLSSLAPGLDPMDHAGCVQRILRRCLPLFLHARAQNVAVTVDMEQWELHAIAGDVFAEIVTHPEIASWPHAGIVVQAYLKEAWQDLERLLALARSRGAPLQVRLVKGAYWDHEIVRARQHGYECPVFTDKPATDANYEALTVALLEHIDDLRPAFGSHNLRSVAHAVASAREMGVPPLAYELQMLYGMAEPERRAIQSLGQRVRLYAPVGELLPGMAYLVRRLLENTANSSFIRLSFHEKANIEELLAPPRVLPLPPPQLAAKSADLTAPFTNAPYIDFADTAIRDRFIAALERVRAALPREVPAVIDGATHLGTHLGECYCPSDTSLLVTKVRAADVNEATAAVEAAMEAWPSWRDRPVENRADLLVQLADRLEADRFDLAALETWEVAKPWREADTDVAEAIDFCRYYAHQALVELSPRRQTGMAGEDNMLVYEGRGPTAVIAPWNFPLAILTGMTAAALVTGNPVIIKPAEQSSAVAYELYQRMIAAGFPENVVHFVPGTGEIVGAHLVRYPLVAQVTFTGSKAVGLNILATAARVVDGQPQLRRVVCEMGGKNAILIDEDADLDRAVAGVVQGAFGYAGQKCSACSRAIVVGTAFEPFMTRLVDACRSLRLAPAHHPECQLGPVIDAQACERLHSVIADPGAGAEAVYIGEAPDGGWFVPPAVFVVDDSRHRLMQEELFGPVLAVMRVATFDDALTIAADSEYALTGAVYSRLPSHLEAARRQFRVGNLYLNRVCTGASVHRQPFGGLRRSGLGTKAGGPGYLLNFVDLRCICENTARHGFTPDVTL